MFLDLTFREGCAWVAHASGLASLINSSRGLQALVKHTGIASAEERDREKLRV